MILDFPIFGMQPAMILWSPWWSRCSPYINNSPKPARLTKKLLCNGASRPRTGRSTGARLYGLMEEEIGIVEDAA
jgi:hypothetical protein